MSEQTNITRTSDSKVAVTVWIATDRVGSTMTRTVKFDREDWDGWSNSEKGAAVWDEIMNCMMLSWGWHE